MKKFLNNNKKNELYSLNFLLSEYYGKVNKADLKKIKKSKNNNHGTNEQISYFFYKNISNIKR